MGVSWSMKSQTSSSLIWRVKLHSSHISIPPSDHFKVSENYCGALDANGPQLLCPPVARSCPGVQQMDLLLLRVYPQRGSRQGPLQLLALPPSRRGT